MVAGLRAPASPKTATSPAAAFISNPLDASGRNALLAGLMQSMPVDSFGKLLRNRSMHDTPDRSAKQGVIAAYKFTLAFESSICRDYVTEKFFDPLLAGSVPVYLGAPNIAELAPADDCYVDASRFESPRVLAAHLMAPPAMRRPMPPCCDGESGPFARSSWRWSSRCAAPRSSAWLISCASWALLDAPRELPFARGR
jgi:hypothetical protein